MEGLCTGEGGELSMPWTAVPFLMALDFSAFRWACAGLIDLSLGILLVSIAFV